MKIAIVLPLMLILCLPRGGQAFPVKDPENNCTKCHSLTIAEAKEIIGEVGEVQDVKEASIKSLWEIKLEKDGRKGKAFMDFGKKHIIAGPIFDIQPMDIK